MDVGLVCDACSALTPIGVPQCARCGAAVALDPRPHKQSRPPPAATTAAAICSKCGTNAGKQKFCPNCGHRMPSAGAESFEGETRVGPIAGANGQPPTSPLPS